jgi:hypothetical protein
METIAPAAKDPSGPIAYPVAIATLVAASGERSQRRPDVTRQSFLKLRKNRKI